MKRILRISIILFLISISNVRAQSDTLNYELTADSIPKYIYGEDSLFHFIQRFIRYPIYARENKIQGKVYISFVIDTLGQLRDSAILHDIDGGCGIEAIKVMNKTNGDWIPAYKNEKKVNYKMTFPVSFKIGPDGPPLYISRTNALYNQAVASYKNNDFKRAKYLFSEVLKIDPKDKGAYYSRALTWRKLGNQEEACKDFKKSIELGYIESAPDLGNECK